MLGSASAENSVAFALASALRAAGVERVYGLPGEDHLRLLDALEAAGMTYVGARDENSAAIMAATEAQATGVAGVVLVTIAPGLTNAINGIAYAHLDHIPLVIITGQHNPERAPLMVRQLLDNHRLVHSLTRWTTTAGTRIHQVLAKVLDTALAPPGGPVLLELRDDVAALAATDSAADWPTLQGGGRTIRVGGGVAGRETGTSASGADLRDGGLDKVRGLVRQATRPAIVVGGRCPTDPLTAKAIGAGAAALRAPVFASPSALGILGDADPWLAGTFMNGNLEAEILGQCDVLLTLGLDATDFFNAAWRYQVPIVALNTLPDSQRYAPVHFQLLGEPAAVLAALSAGQGASEWRPADVAGYRCEMEQPFRLGEGAFTIASALRCARSMLPLDTRVAIDAGFGKPLASYLWSAPAPNMYFTAHGLSTMGYALPAANALQLAYPSQPVVAFMGDGSLLMRASEISVAAQHGIAPIYIAWMDGALAQIEVKQLRQNLRPVGARLPDSSCAKIADAFGGVGTDAHTLDEFRRALQAGLETRVPTLIGARVDQRWRAQWYELMRG
jgi:acetolactate synthase I/II/III large subunit